MKNVDLVMEDAIVESIRLFKCRRNPNHVAAHDSLFVFMSRFEIHKGEPTDAGPYSGTIEFWPRNCVAQPMRLCECIEVAVEKANLFIDEKTVKKISRDICCNFNSRFRIEDASSEYSLVIVVDVWAAYASQGFIDAKERLIELDSTTTNVISPVVVNQESVDVVCVDVNWDNDDIVLVDGDEEFEEDYEDEDDEMEYEYPEDKDYMPDIIERVKSWQRVGSDIDTPVLEEVKSTIKIETLERTRIGNDMFIDKEEEKHGECSICLASYPGIIRRNPKFRWLSENHSTELVRLGCGHCFHHRCIMRWLVDHRTCPLCRAATCVDA